MVFTKRVKGGKVMLLFDYLENVDYAQGLVLEVGNWKLNIPYASKEFVPYNVLRYVIVSEGIRIDENGKLVIPIRG